MQNLTLELPMYISDDEQTPYEHPREVPFNKLTIEPGEIEHGTFGTVKSGFWNRSSGSRKPVAIKFQRNSEFAAAETKLHYQLFHPKIVLLLAISRCPGNFCIILEKMDEDLFHFLDRNSHITPEKKLDIAMQITEGVVYLHDKAHVIHRDLKIENVLLRGNQVKIADFGMSTKISAKKRSRKNIIIGTWQAYAPELIGENQLFTPKTDIYALAILLYELQTQKGPYSERFSMEMMLSKIKNGERPNMVGCRGPLVSVIPQGWAPDPANRPLARELLTLLLAVSVENRGVEQETSHEELPANSLNDSLECTPITRTAATASHVHFGSENILQRKPVKKVETEDQWRFHLSM